MNQCDLPSLHIFPPGNKNERILKDRPPVPSVPPLLLLMLPVRMALVLDEEGGLTTTTSRHLQSFDHVSCMVGDVDLDGDAPNDRFGFAVSLSGDGRRMAVATGTRAPGLVKVYERDGAGASWVRMGADITGLSNYGTTVSLSEDGSILAVGAEQNSLVRVYQWDGTNSGWIPMGSDITSIVAGSKDLTGGSVSLSSDGTRVPVGSHYYEQNYRGYVRVFEWDAGANSWNLMGSGLPGTWGMPLAIPSRFQGTETGSPLEHFTMMTTETRAAR